MCRTLHTHPEGTLDRCQVLLQSCSKKQTLRLAAIPHWDILPPSLPAVLSCISSHVKKMVPLGVEAVTISRLGHVLVWGEFHNHTCSYVESRVPSLRPSTWVTVLTDVPESWGGVSEHGCLQVKRVDDDNVEHEPPALPSSSRPPSRP